MKLMMWWIYTIGRYKILKMLTSSYSRKCWSAGKTQYQSFLFVVIGGGVDFKVYALRCFAHIHKKLICWMFSWKFVKITALGFFLFFFSQICFRELLRLFLHLLILVFWSYMLTLKDFVLCEAIFKSLSFHWKYILLELKNSLRQLARKQRNAGHHSITLVSMRA